MGCSGSLESAALSGPSSTSNAVLRAGKSGKSSTADTTRQPGSKPNDRQALPPDKDLRGERRSKEAKALVPTEPPEVIRGAAVKPYDPHGGTNVIFLFGGPGAFKGAAIDMMCREFGFCCISLEKMLLEQAHRTLKQRNVKDVSAAALYEYLFSSPEVTAMDVALGHAFVAMKRNPSKRNFVIDVVPNTRAVATRTLLLRDAAKHIAAVDHSDFNARFALAITSRPTAAKIESKPAPTDEVDATRRQRRSLMHSMASQPVLEIFERSHRLVHVLRPPCAMGAAALVRSVLLDLAFPPVAPSLVLLLLDEASDMRPIIERFSFVNTILDETECPDFTVLVDVLSSKTTNKHTMHVTRAPWLLRCPLPPLSCEVPQHVWLHDSEFEPGAQGLRAVSVHPRLVVLLPNDH